MTAPRFRRNAACTAREAGGAIFIATPANEIIELDAIASAVWRLLDRPQTANSIVAVLSAAFPAEPEKKIRVDVDALLAKMLKSEAIQRHGES